ncbi:MAG: thiol reductant ABC exporter subunit CydC [Austwickia sp.]|nr:thiol reductant ABC exporter subunit CydC [Austwickia sp.]
MTPPTGTPPTGTPATKTGTGSRVAGTPTVPLDATATAVGPAATIRPFGRPRVVTGILPAALVGGLALTCGVALTTTAGWLIVAASYRPQILTLLAAIVLVRAFGIARPALRYAERIRSHDAALRFLADERATTYSRLIPLTPARLGRRSRGDVLAGVVDDLDDIAYAQVRVVVPVVALLFAGLLAAVANALFCYPAAVVTLVQIGMTLLVGWVGLRAERWAQRDLVAARAQVSRVTALVAGNAPELAAIGAGDQALTWLDDGQRRLAAALARQGRARALGVTAMPLLTAAHACAMAAVVVANSDRLTAPVAAFLLLTPIALGEVVAAIPDAMGALARARGAGSRLDVLLGATPAVRDPAPPESGTNTGASGASEAWRDVGQTRSRAAESRRTEADRTSERGVELALHGVTATWDGERAALAGFTDRIEPGSRVAVVGANGSGKSTLLAVLARHLDPATGSYRIGGQDVTRMPLAASRAPLALVDDEPHVFASTLRENLRFARPESSDDDLVRALRLVGLRDWWEALPGGLDTPLGATGRGVSGGERARLALARAVLSERAVLLLDEPVAHLDQPTASAVLRDLWEATTGRTVVLVAHRPEGLDEVDRVIRLGDPQDGPGTPWAGPR